MLAARPRDGVENRLGVEAVRVVVRQGVLLGVIAPLVLLDRQIFRGQRRHPAPVSGATSASPSSHR